MDVRSAADAPPAPGAVCSTDGIEMAGSRSRDANASLALRLYVAGQTPRSMAAIAHLRSLCQEHLQEGAAVEVIDVTLDPQRAADDQVLVLPTLVRHAPSPPRHVIGDLSDPAIVLEKLELTDRAAP